MVSTTVTDRTIKMQTPDDQPRQRRIVIALAALIALVMVALGVMAIITGYHVGHGRNSVLIVLDGARARWMGAVQVCIGMLALAIAMPSKTVALRWAIGWLVLGTLCFIAGMREV
jgi:uncharacterized membrane protein YgdD (TMEM256/DUF423 family)